VALRAGRQNAEIINALSSSQTNLFGVERRKMVGQFEKLSHLITMIDIKYLVSKALRIALTSR
jgi:hypothetical protein